MGRFRRLEAPSPRSSSSRAPRDAQPAPAGEADLLSWTERHLVIGGRPMRVPGPLRAIYRDDSSTVVVMKGAQMGISEWVLDVALHTADTGRAGRGNSLYVQPGGSNVGDFVRGRVNPIIEASPWLSQRVGEPGTKRANNVGMQHIGLGQCYWRSAGVTGRGHTNRSGLKSTPVDTLILDEYDEMPPDTLSVAKHRLDSSRAPRTLIISTPTYPGAGIEPEYLKGDQRRYFLRCPECDTSQPIEWDKNVVVGPDARRRRVCVRCRESMEAVIARAWEPTDEAAALGEWVPTNPEGAYPSYHISQMYRPGVDLDEIHRALNDSNITKRQEAHNQHLGMPFSPPGGQLSLEELTRAACATFTMAEVAGVQECWMGVDIGARLHAWIESALPREAGHQRYLVGAFEIDHFDELDELMRRFGVLAAVVDARPELRMAQAFQRRHPGRVYLAEYVADRMPPLLIGPDDPDPKRHWRVQVDRTAAMDAAAANIRSLNVMLPRDAESVPGLFSMLQAPVRRLVPDAQGNPRAVYEEGARADHFYHAAVYAELALIVAQQAQVRRWVDARDLRPGFEWAQGL